MQGITQKKLAKALGISDSYLTNLLLGKRHLSWARAKNWAEKLSTKPHILMDADPSKLREILLMSGKDLIN